MKVPFQLDEFYLDLQEDGNKVRILSPAEITKCPFPGLRPFKTSEFQLFYGRMGQGEELTKRLKKNHFLAVIGSSGTGKSSLVRAGLIPQLLGGYLHGAGSKWDIAICRPGKDPVENLAVALAASKAKSKNNIKIQECFNEIEPKLNESLYGLLEVKQLFDEEDINGNEQDGTSNLLVIIDQFEELFRFERKDLGKENIENQFVNLLLKASHDPSRSVYVIITMRSEFLGDCVKYRGLPEAINEGQYLVPQLTRNELKEVIENPIKVAGKSISPNLVELLINEIEESKLKENLDQLPILQHALMRTYSNAAEEGPDTLIDIRHYEAVGEMDKALANHAEDKFRQLGDSGSNEKNLSKKQQIARIIFQALTELSSDKKSGRRPTELKKIYAVARSIGASEKEVDEVVNHFRDTDTSFIMPPINTALNPDLILDISHESLMRNWNRLNDWLTEEMKYKALYRQLNERRQLHENDNEEWLRGTLLRELLDWRASYANNATWAERYQRLPGSVNDEQWHNAVYKSNINFLNESEVEHEKQRQEEARELKENIAREQRTKAAKARVFALTVALIVIGFLAVWAFTQKSYANKQRKKAVENAAEAEKQTLLAKKNADSARMEREVAKELQHKAELIADTLLQQSIALTKQKMELQKQTRLALQQKKIAEEQTALANERGNELARIANQLKLKTDTAIQQQNKLEKQLVKNVLKKEPFYFSKSIDQATKEEIIDSLFKAPSLDSIEIKLGKHINLDILRFINEAVRIKENVNDDPAGSLADALAVWNANKHPVIKKILLGVVNDNIFANQTVYATPGGSLQSPKLSVSGMGNGFIISDANDLITGTTQNGKIILNETSLDTGFSRFFCHINDSGIKNKNIMYAGYGDNNLPVAVIDSFRVMLSKEGSITNISSSHLLKNYSFAFGSPNGKKILLTDRDGTISLWEAASASRPEHVDSLRGFRRRDISSNNVAFSPDSRYVLIFPGKEAKLFDEELRIVDSANRAKDKINAAVYTAGNKIITVAQDKLSVRDSLLNRDTSFTEIDLESIAFDEPMIEPSGIDAVVLSPNWKKAVITQKNGGAFLLESKTGESLFSAGSVKAGIKIKELASNEQGRSSLYNVGYSNTRAYRRKPKLYAAFSNDSTIITADENGVLKLWGVYSPFTDPAIAIRTVYPAAALNDKLVSGETSVAAIINNGTAPELNTAANFYFKLEQNDTTRIIYEKLLKDAPAEMQPYYLSRLIDINTEFINVARINAISKQQTPDAIKEYRWKRSVLLKENIEYIKKQTTICPLNKGYRKSLSIAYGNLSFSLIFISDFDGAVASAKEGLALNPDNDWIYTNLALGNLLAGNYQAAEKIYIDYKDKTFNDRSRTFKDAFSSDIKDIENAGVPLNRRQSINVDAIKKILKY